MSLAEGILDLLFPPKCPFCQKILEHPRAPLCPACQPELAWLEGAAGERRVDFTCGCFSPLGYRGRTAQAVKRYKFQRVRAYAEPLGELMAQCLQDRLPQGADLVTWAPLSQKRLRERGFNQAELLARRSGTPAPSPVWLGTVSGRPTRKGPMSCCPGRRCPGSGWCWWTMWSPPARPSPSAPGCCGRRARRRYTASPWPKPGGMRTGLPQNFPRKRENCRKKRLKTRRCPAII